MTADPMEPAWDTEHPNRLRLARLARGVSQVDLARAVGVTRQAIAGIESGRWDPSLKVALAISDALSSTIEDLFGHETDPEAIDVELLHPTGSQATRRVRIGRVADRSIAHFLDRDNCFPAGFGQASGVVIGSVDPFVARVQPFGTLDRTLVIAGCDPAIPLLQAPLAALKDPVDLFWVRCGSEHALELGAAGKVHAAGAHLRDPATGTYNSTHARAALAGMGAEVIGFANWMEGITVDSALREQVSDLTDIVHLGLRIVNREKGSEARNLLEREMSRLSIGEDSIVGFGTAASGHLMVASAISAKLADAGIANEAAAVTYGHHFIPLVTERYDLVVPATMMATEEVAALLRVLGMTATRRQLNSLPGYDASICGEVLDTF